MGPNMTCKNDFKNVNYKSMEEKIFPFLIKWENEKLTNSNRPYNLCILQQTKPLLYIKTFFAFELANTIIGASHS